MNRSDGSIAAWPPPGTDQARGRPESGDSVHLVRHRERDWPTGEDDEAHRFIE
jgi:hypothetical protein